MLFILFAHWLFYHTKCMPFTGHTISFLMALSGLRPILRVWKTTQIMEQMRMIADEIATSKQKFTTFTSQPNSQNHV